MALGMEMLVGTVIKAIGLEPEAVINQAKQFAQDIIAQVKSFDTRLTTLEQQNAQLIEQNAKFISHIEALTQTKESEN